MFSNFPERPEGLFRLLVEALFDYPVALLIQ